MATTAIRLRDRPSEVVVRARRSEVLAALRDAAEPLPAQEVATRTGLHLNTARFHLDALVTDGLAQRTVEQRDSPGRPRVLYAAHLDTPGPRSFGLLAEMLTGLVVARGAAGPAAVQAGREWGRRLVEPPPPSQSVNAADATARLNRVLDAIGFQPEVRIGTDGTDVRLHHCPFREVAQRHPEVICALHLGLMQGALAEARAPVHAASLEPLVRPDLCIAHLEKGPQT